MNDDGTHKKWFNLKTFLLSLPVKNKKEYESISVHSSHWRTRNVILEFKSRNYIGCTFHLTKRIECEIVLSDTMVLDLTNWA